MAEAPADGGPAVCPACGESLLDPRAMPLVLPGAASATMDAAPIAPDRDLTAEGDVVAIAITWFLAGALGLAIILLPVIVHVVLGPRPEVWRLSTPSDYRQFAVGVMGVAWGGGLVALSWGLRNFRAWARGLGLIALGLQLLLVIATVVLLSTNRPRLWPSPGWVWIWPFLICAIWIVCQALCLLRPASARLFVSGYAERVARSPELRSAPLSSPFLWVPLVLGACTLFCLCFQPAIV